MKHDQRKHLLMMLACCLVPITLILIVSVFGVNSLTPLLSYALVLVCPLMMFLMMRGMMSDHKDVHQHTSGQTPIVDTSGRVGQVDAESSREQCH